MNFADAVLEDFTLFSMILRKCSILGDFTQMSRAYHES